MSRQRIHLSISRKTENTFKDFAKKLFPREAFGILIGTAAGSSFTADYIYIPEDCAEHTTESKIEPPAEWFVDAHEQAKEDGLHFLGSIHSHPYRYQETPGRVISDRVQSEGDYEYMDKWGGLAGICTVHELMRKTGDTYLRASVKFWGPTVLVTTKYIDNKNAKEKTTDKRV